MTGSRSFLVIVGLLLAALPGLAQSPDGQVMHENGRFTLQIERVIAAPRASVFAVLTDYDRLHLLDESILEARVIQHVSPTVVDVYTLARGCAALLFCRTVERVERVVASPPANIEAEVNPEQSDFRYGRTTWQLTSQGAVTRLVSTFEVEPDFRTPRFVARRLMRRATLRTLANLERLAQEHAAENGEDFTAAR